MGGASGCAGASKPAAERVAARMWAAMMRGLGRGRRASSKQKSRAARCGAAPPRAPVMMCVIPTCTPFLSRPRQWPFRTPMQERCIAWMWPVQKTSTSNLARSGSRFTCILVATSWSPLSTVSTYCVWHGKGRERVRSTPEVGSGRCAQALNACAAGRSRPSRRRPSVWAITITCANQLLTRPGCLNAETLPCGRGTAALHAYGTHHGPVAANHHPRRDDAVDA